MNKYDFEIETEKIRPLGSMHYAAKARVWKRIAPDKMIEIVGPGESWGATAEEAHSKAKKAVEEWIAKQELQ